MAAPKEYGLIKRGQNKDNTVIQPRLSIFDEDDDSDEDGRKGVGKSLQKEADRINAKKQLKLDLQSALADDPTVFEYDNVYDDMVQKKNEEIGVQKKAKVKKSRYIDSLLKAAQSRKLDQERATERKVQKERLAEGGMFADKEAFVTSAYKKKMQEMQEQEEKDRREAQIEAITDVTKQRDLSGFYRQLYRQTLGPKNETEKDEKDVSVTESKSTLDGEESKEEEKPSSSRSTQEGVRKPRQFRRQRKESTSSSSENENEDELGRQRVEKKRRRHSERSTLEYDAKLNDPNCNSSMVNEEAGERHLKAKKLTATGRTTSVSPSDEDSCGVETAEAKENRSQKRTKGGDKSEKDCSDATTKKSKKNDDEESPRISAREKLLTLFTKRTVGDVFEIARQRFLARREARNAERMESVK